MRLGYHPTIQANLSFRGFNVSNIGTLGVTGLATLSGGASIGGAVNFNSNAVTNIDINSGTLSGVTVDGDLTWSSAQTGVTLTSPAINGTVTTTGLTLPAFTANSTITLVNNVALQGKDAGGTARELIKLGGDNRLYIYNDAAERIHFKTDNSSGVGNLVNRITITGNIDIADIGIYYSTFNIKPDGSNSRFKVEDTAITLSTSAPVSNLKLGNDMDANGQTISSIGTLDISNGGSIRVDSSTNSHTYSFKAWDVDGAAYATVAGLANANDPYFYFGGAAAFKFYQSGWLWATGTIHLSDDTKLSIGSDPDYWLKYNSTGTQFEFWTTNNDGSDTNGVVFYVPDGSDDVYFNGVIAVGTHAAIGAEEVTGYITIKDSSGTDRKLAVVS